MLMCGGLFFSPRMQVFIFPNCPDAINMNTVSVFTLLLHNLQAHLLFFSASSAMLVLCDVLWHLDESGQTCLCLIKPAAHMCCVTNST